jgi:hypothetical protein
MNFDDHHDIYVKFLLRLSDQLRFLRDIVIHTTYWLKTFNINSNFINNFLQLLNVNKYLIKVNQTWNFYL